MSGDPYTIYLCFSIFIAILVYIGVRIVKRETRLYDKRQEARDKKYGPKNDPPLTRPW